jgi:TPR repeat protein
MIETDEEKASREELRKLFEAARSGDGLLNNILGDRYKYGLGVPEDHAEALRYFLRAEKAGDTNSLLSIADAYQRGNGVIKDEKKAVQYLRRAANGNDKSAAAFAANRLCWCYVYGWGVEPDKAEAKRWRSRACELAENSKLAPDQMRNFTGPGPLEFWKNRKTTRNGPNLFITDKTGLRHYYPETVSTLRYGFAGLAAAAVFAGLGAWLNENLYFVATAIAVVAGIVIYTEIPHLINLGMEKEYHERDRLELEQSKRDDREVIRQQPFGAQRSEGVI